MHKKDYTIIADAVAKAVKEIKLKEPLEDQRLMLDGISYVIDFLMEACKEDNQKFNEEKFLLACRAY